VQIAKAFHRASNYDRHAEVQRRVANRLAEQILALDPPTQARVLEIGCGTGFLGEALIGRLSYSHYRMTDIAPGMLDRAHQRFAGVEGIEFAQMDGAQPTVSGPFDLICSSLAMQWMPDLGQAVARLRALLSPDGKLVFNTLADGSFEQWRSAYAGRRPGIPDYPTAAALRALGLTVSVETIDHHYASARDFLSALKAIGAGTPRAGYQPLPPALLRQVMGRFEAQGAQARYVVATCTAGPVEPA
jgi:malonyl-CoA O-methyltransferase